MKLLALARTALRSILKNRMRSILTSLGIIIGVMAVIVMVAVGEGSRTQIQSEISALGSNLLMVFPGSASSRGVSLGSGSRDSLTVEDVENLEERVPAIGAISPVVMAQGQVVGGGNNWSTRVYGVEPDYFDIKNWELDHGTFFTDEDVRRKKKVAVLGATVAEELFPGEDPTGRKIRIGNIPFLVLGVHDEKGQTGMGQDQDDSIIAPYSTVLYRMKGSQYLDMIAISAVSDDRIDEAQEKIKSVLRSIHRLSDEDEDDFRILNQAEIIEKVGEITGILTALLGSVAAVSLIVGGIGIMNIMLVSVTERTREIGIRMSVGARKSDILTQFLIESMILSMIGGTIGVVLAMAVSYGLTALIGLETIVAPEMVLMSFLFAAAVGIFFGYYPARKAASLNPIEALRYE